MKKLLKFIFLVVFLLIILLLLLLSKELYNKSGLKDKNSAQIKTELLSELEKIKNKDK